MRDGRAKSPEDTETERPRAAKRYTAGTHRIVAPEETRERLRPLLDAVGITRVAEVTAIDRLGVPVYQAVRPGSWSISVSQGKGATRTAAWVSAVMESLEIWHAERLPGVPSVEVSVREMESSNAVQLEDFGVIPHQRLEDATVIEWVPAVPLAGKREAWLPKSLVHLDFRTPLELRPQLLRPTSNGLASGNCREEALLHALCELIEREAVYLARLDATQKRPIRLGSVESAWTQSLLGRLHDGGARVALWDISGPASVPVVAAEVAVPDIPRLWGGSGCHPSAEVAASRALTEAAQSRLTYLSGAREDLPDSGSETDIAGGRDAVEIWELHKSSTDGGPLSALPDFASDDVGADLEAIIERMVGAGYPPFALELTHPELGVPVWRAYAPGLREAHHI